MAPHPPELVSTKEAARILGKTQELVRYLVRVGKLEPIAGGGHRAFYFLRQDVEAIREAPWRRDR
jgi:hypothetical protein